MNTGTLLAHVQVGAGVIGIWRVYRDKLEWQYVPKAPLKLREEAESVLHKGPKQTWAEVFEYATRKSPYASQFHMVPNMDEDDDLEHLLEKVRRQYMYGQLKTTNTYEQATSDSQ